MEDAIATTDATQHVAQAWLQRLRDWGIEHGPVDQEISMEADTDQYYLTDEPYKSGDRARIIYPYWQYQAAVIDKGLVKLLPTQIEA